MRVNLKLLAAVLVIAFAVVGGVLAQEEDPGTIVDIAVGNEDFSTLVAAVEAAGLVDVLADPEAEWTVFAPTNAAFEALPEGALDAALADTELLTRILTYHVVEGTVTSDQLSSMMAPTMEMTAPGAELLGGQLDVVVNEDGSVTVNGANVVTADIIASNGVIHVIDAVLLPEDIAAMLSGEDMMAEEGDMMEGDTMAEALFATTNPAELEGDSVVRLESDLSAVAATYDGLTDIASIQSVDFNAAGDAYLSIDATADAGSIVVVEGLANGESMAIGAGTRTIGGANPGLVTPKGIQVIDSLNLVLVANFGASNIKGFPADGSGDLAPTVLISDFDGVGGSVWDFDYDETSDTLWVAGTTGAVFVFTGFAESLGADGPSSVFYPADAGGAQISVNLHGIDYDASTDTLFLSDVGSADSNTDGQLFTISNASAATGNVAVSARIFGEGTSLGNPVDIAFDGVDLYVAEKANDLVLRYDNILDVMGESNAAAEGSLTVTKPESVALAASGMMGEMTEEAMEEPAGTIVDIAVGNEDFSTLVAAVEAAGLVDVLADPEAEWTVFAPTNAAFEALPEGALDAALADTELLTRILTYHVVEGTVTSDQLSSMMAPTMEMTAPGAELLGGQLEVVVNEDGSVTVNGANVVTADIIASNGVIHVIDAVLLPEDIAAMLSE